MQEHVKGYHELSTTTKIYFANVVALWDADFYVKVDDDVHVNIGNNQNCYKSITCLSRIFAIFSTFSCFVNLMNTILFDTNSNSYARIIYSEKIHSCYSKSNMKQIRRRKKLNKPKN